MKMRWCIALLLAGCGSPPPLTTNDPPEGGLEDGAPLADTGTPGEARVDAGSAPAAICQTGGWCWDLPAPQGNDLFGVWTSGAPPGTGSPAGLFAVGALGTVLRYDGARWSKMQWPGASAVRAVWGSADDDVWAAGDDGAIGHFDGVEWRLDPFVASASAEAGGRPRLLGIAGTGESDVWIVGEGGTILHYDGATWSPATTSALVTLRAVYAADPADVWIVGDGTAALHYDGSTWTPRSGSGVPSNLRAIHGTGRNDVWAVGERGVATHFDGSTWTATTLDAAVTLSSVRIDGPDSVWTAGTGGAIFHYAPVAKPDAGGGDAGSTDGGADAAVQRRWTRVPAGITSNLYSACGDSDQVWFVGSLGEVLRGGAGSWTRLSSGSTETRLAISGSSASDVWIAGDETLHGAAGGWSRVDSGTQRALYALASSGPGRGWGVGTGGSIVKLGTGDGGSWETVDSPTTQWLRGVWTSGPSVGWIVGARGTTLALLNGTAWQVVPVAGINADLDDVWGSAADDVWAVGARGTILHWRGTSWSMVSGGPDGGTGDLRGVWGASASDVWAVGTSGTILHYNGLSWAPVASGEAYSLNDVWGASASDVWAVGTGGTIVHWNGATWTPQPSGTDASLNAVWGEPGIRIWAVGERGVVLRHDP